MLAYFLAFGCTNEWVALDADGDGWTVGAGDCWDETALHGELEGSAIHPQAPDVPYDGVDADCAGDDDFDHDGDGYVTSVWADPVTEGIPSSLPGGDCWDDRDEIEQEFGALPGFPQLAAADVHPGAFETWYDGIDQNCDGSDDFDQDADGHASTLHRDGASALGDDCFDAIGDPFENPAALAPADVHPAATDVCYDATDADCDGASDWDCDGDGFLLDADCDDDDPDARPGATEIWYDGIDQDCDGNDGDKDHDGFLALDYAGSVRAPGIAEGDCWDDPDEPWVPLNGFPALASASVNPATVVETYYDGIDANCDGHSDFDADDDSHDTEEYADAVGTLGDDCDDHNADVRPGASETCGTPFDDDCDGDDNDTDALGCSERYFDSDGDLHGAILAVSQCTCGEPPWSGLADDDCDDADASVHPDATEVVGNGTDEDCNGEELCYIDVDGDSYRPDDDTIVSGDSDCADPGEADATVADGDCNDAVVEINPGAAEDCNTGIDENCDGSSSPCALAGSHSIDTIATSSIDGGVGSGFGSTIAAGELGGDAKLDVAITASLDQTVYGFLGPLTASSMPSSFAITNATSGFGEALAIGADLDGLGDDDVAIGSPFADTNSGEVFLFFGPLSGSYDETDADLILNGASGDDHLGYALATGDWDADGIDDLAIGASAQDTGATNSGSLWIFVGPLDGSASLTDADSFDGSFAEDRAARSIARGDLDADGDDELVVGAPGSDQGASGAGAIYAVEPLVPGELEDSNTYALYGSVGSAAGGTAVAIPGDLDGDGFPDLLVGAPFRSADAGAAYFIMADAIVDGESFASIAEGTVLGAADDLAGSAVGSAGDLDNDGRIDVAIGAPGSSQVAIFYVPPVGEVDLAAADLVLQSTDDELGAAFAAVGDQDGDTVEDLIIGGPAEASGGTGTAWILLGAGM